MLRLNAANLYNYEDPMVLLSWSPIKLNCRYNALGHWLRKKDDAPTWTVLSNLDGMTALLTHGEAVHSHYSLDEFISIFSESKHTIGEYGLENNNLHAETTDLLTLGTLVLLFNGSKGDIVKDTVEWQEHGWDSTVW